jgi:hypothetical protein
MNGLTAPLKVVSPDDRHGAPRGVDGGLWQGVGRLLDGAVALEEMRPHGLELFALGQRDVRGRHVPDALVVAVRGAMMKTLAAPLVLQRVRELVDGPILLLKGPETAACYLEPSARPFNDLDLLVRDAVQVQRALIGAGFKQVGDEARYLGGHQMAPLRHPDFPLPVEVHIRPHWVDGIPPPSPDQLFETAVPSVAPVAGISALPRVSHAILLAVHAWAHEPLGSLRQLIDVAAVRQGVPTDELTALAQVWGVERIWRTTTATIDALFFGAPQPWPLRTWARSLTRVCERTVLETHLERWLAGFSAFPPGRAAGMALRAVATDLRPMGGEDWTRKLGRTSTAIRNTFLRRSWHDAEVERRSRSGVCPSLASTPDE